VGVPTNARANKLCDLLADLEETRDRLQRRGGRLPENELHANELLVADVNMNRTRAQRYFNEFGVTGAIQDPGFDEWFKRASRQVRELRGVSDLL
jgi:hypothetical protein